MVHHALDQHALLKWSVDDDRDPALGRKWQQPFFYLAVHHVVAERHEVDGLVAHNALEIAMPPSLGGGDADVAHTPLRLHRLQCFDVGAPIEKVMDLHQIETLHTPEPARILHLVDSKLLERGPHLAGREERTLVFDAGEAVADHRFGRTIHRRRIDQAPAPIEKGLHYLGAGGAEIFVTADIEGDPGSQADDRNLLTAGRDRLFQVGSGGRSLPKRWKRRRRPETSNRPDERTARQMTHGYHMACLTVALPSGGIVAADRVRAIAPRTMTAACGAIRATRAPPLVTLTPDWLSDRRVRLGHAPCATRCRHRESGPSANCGGAPSVRCNIFTARPRTRTGATPAPDFSHGVGRSAEMRLTRAG